MTVSVFADPKKKWRASWNTIMRAPRSMSASRTRHRSVPRPRSSEEGYLVRPLCAVSTSRLATAKRSADRGRSRLWRCVCTTSGWTKVRAAPAMQAHADSYARHCWCAFTNATSRDISMLMLVDVMLVDVRLQRSPPQKGLAAGTRGGRTHRRRIRLPSGARMLGNTLLSSSPTRDLGVSSATRCSTRASQCRSSGRSTCSTTSHKHCGGDGQMV